MGMMGGGRPAQPPAPPKRGFLQELALREVTDSATDVSVEIRSGGLTRTRGFQSGVDYMGMYAAADSISAPVVFAGYGIVEKDIAWDELKTIDVKGKIVMVLSEAPGKDNPASPFQQKKELKDKYFPAGPAMFMRRMGGFNKALEITKLGAAAILQVQVVRQGRDMFKSLAGPRPVDDERPIIDEPRRQMSLAGAAQRMPWEGSPVITITHEMADAILQGAGQKVDELQNKIDTTLKPASMELPGTRLNIAVTSKSALVRSANVVGYIEGSDPKLKDEVVVVGAHLDHLGRRGDYIYNGADDNGSGSVGVMALARAFAANPGKPKRTVVFALWTGEEKGLLGSRYYVMNPPFPMDKTVAYLNMDMISRPYTEENLGMMARMMNIPHGRRGLQEGQCRQLRAHPIFRGRGARRRRPERGPACGSGPLSPGVGRRDGPRHGRQRPRLLRSGEGAVGVRHHQHARGLPPDERQRRQGQRGDDGQDRAPALSHGLFAR